MCCEVHLFVAMQMHSSNGNGYIFIIMSCGLRSEPKNDKLCIWLSWDALIILPPLHPHGEFMGQSPNSFDWPQHRIQIAHCFSSVAVYVCHGLVLLFFLTIIFCLKTHDVFMHVSAPELKASWKIWVNLDSCFVTAPNTLGRASAYSQWLFLWSCQSNL